MKSTLRINNTCWPQMALLFSAAQLNAEITIYQAPAEAPRATYFSVDIRQGGEEWQPVETYAIKVDKTQEGKHQEVLTSVATFDFDGEVDIRVISKKQSVETAQVRPLSYGITPRIAGDTLIFKLDRPRYISVEVNEERFDNLQIFANPLDSNRPENIKKWSKNKNNIYFGPGYHKLDTVMTVESGKNIYIAGGAWIDGFLHVKGDNVKISGRGIIRPEKRGAGIEVQNSRNVEIEGIFTTQCPVGGSRDVKISNVKVISHYGWGDGFNVFASDDVHYDNVFARTSDDCTTIYATRKGYVGGVKNVTMENAVLWADVAHPIMIGVHGSAKELGPEATPDTIQNIKYRNIDVLDHHEMQLDYQGVMAIDAGDNNIVRDITFENVNVEDFRKGRLIDIRVFFNQKYCGAPGLAVENIRFKNIEYNGNKSELSMIMGYDEERKVKGIYFTNLKINGRTISDDMPGKPGWYKTGDMARIFIGEHVEDVAFDVE